MRLTIVAAAIFAVAGGIEAAAIKNGADNTFLPPKGGYKLHDGKATKFKWDTTPMKKGEKITLRVFPKGRPHWLGAALLENEKNTGEYSWTPTDQIPHGHNIIEIEDERGDKEQAPVE